MSLYGDVRRWWASRTINFGALLAMAGPALEFLQAREPMLIIYFGSHGPWVFSAVGVAVIVLRVITTQPIIKPKQPQE